MVHFWDHATASYQDKLGTKRAVEDDDQEALNKRNKASLPVEQRNSGTDAFHVVPSQYDPLSEPSPLGLSLRKSPSLLDLIERKLSQGNSSAAGPSDKGDLDQRAGIGTKGAYAPVTTEKLKASNFAASLLRIGSWEYKSRYAGDLVVKCYFAKHKLVWEVLDGGLKSKIEIQWSDITGLKADCAADGPGTLTVVLARQPLFFRESSPQPRKHTLWHATTDFTNGEASKYRQHFLQCEEGLLNKHFEKIIHCDMRLNFLSQQPTIVLQSPFFEQQSSVSEGSIGSKFNNLNEVNAYNPEVQASFKIGQEDPAFMELQRQSQITPPFGSDVKAVDGNGSVEASGSKGSRSWEQMKVPGLHPSFSMGDLVNHIGNYITEQMAAGNPSSSKGGSENKEMFDEIAGYLLADTQYRTDSDEKLLMARVNSLCCLLQPDSASAQNFQSNRKSFSKMPDKGKNIARGSIVGLETSGTKGNIMASQGCANNASSCQQTMSRKDSLSDLLFRIRDSEGCPNTASSFQQTAVISKKDSFGDLLFNLFREKASEGCASDAPNYQQTATMLRKDSLSDLLFNLPPMKASEGCANDVSSYQQTAAMSRNDSLSDLLFNLPQTKAYEGCANDASSYHQTAAMSRKDSLSDLLLNLPQMKAYEGCANDASSSQQNEAMSRKDSLSDLLLNLPQMKTYEGCANDASSSQQAAAMLKKDSLSDLLLNLPQMKAYEGCANDASSSQQAAAMSKKDSLSDLLLNLPQMKAYEGCVNDASSSQQTAAMSKKYSLSDLLLNLPQMKAYEGCANDVSSSQQTATMSRKDSLSDLLFRLRAPEGCANDASSSQQTAAMSRNDSLGDLLFDLPRIESLPKFLFDIPGDDGKNK